VTFIVRDIVPVWATAVGIVEAFPEEGSNVLGYHFVAHRFPDRCSGQSFIVLQLLCMHYHNTLRYLYILTHYVT
jgi:hypothetical protein